MTEEIRLVIPAQEDFRPVANLVAGGLATRLGVSYEELDDLQLALDTVLALRDDEEDIVITLEPGDGSLRAAVGPFPRASLAPLDDDGGGLGPRRVLETVTDSFELDERDEGVWVELAKRIPTGEEAR
jgi:hypothetical protein